MNSSNPRWLHLYARGVWASTAFLLVAGALVTGTGSGLAVPDWPLSFGQYMPPMVGGVFFEHGHRMIAGTVGILTLVLAVFTWIFERRLSVRLLSLACLFVVVVQAILGGMTVLFRLPAAVSILHACVAQIFFALLTVYVTTTSRLWGASRMEPEEGLSPWAGAGVLLVFTQVLLGAIMRHFGAGLAIPDFPTMFGSWVPVFPNFEVTVHFLHRVFAVGVTAYVLLLVVRVQRSQRPNLWLVGLSGGLLTLVCIQFFLGALVIWTGKSVAITTAHLLTGALCFSFMSAFFVVARHLDGKCVFAHKSVPLDLAGRVPA